MRSKTKAVLLAGVAAAIVLVALPPLVNRLYEYLVPPPGQSAEDQLSPERKRFMPPERVVQLLNPQPATAVLDLGAGYGLFTIPLAQTVGEHGKVFSTDIDSQALASLSEEALKSGLKNIVPVQVRADGIDDFYRQHTFDTILVSDVIPLISELEVFFGQLRSSLKEDTGRLWVIDLRLDPDFTMLEFDDLNAMGNGTLRLGSQPIIVQRLSEKSRQAASTDTTGTSRNLMGRSSSMISIGCWKTRPSGLRFAPAGCRQVVHYIVDGKSMREIATLLHTSVKTVEKQRRDAMRKLGVDTHGRPGSHLPGNGAEPGWLT